jgi:hypothetical protein
MEKLLELHDNPQLEGGSFNNCPIDNNGVAASPIFLDLTKYPNAWYVVRDASLHHAPIREGIVVEMNSTGSIGNDGNDGNDGKDRSQQRIKSVTCRDEGNPNDPLYWILGKIHEPISPVIIPIDTFLANARMGSSRHFLGKYQNEWAVSTFPCPFSTTPFGTLFTFPKFIEMRPGHELTDACMWGLKINSDSELILAIGGKHENLVSANVTVHSSLFEGYGDTAESHMGFPDNLVFAVSL